MTDPLYSDEAIIRSVTYSTRGGHKVSFEMDPEGWERLKNMETTRCMMVLVPIQNDGQPDPDPKPFTPPDKPRRHMADLSRAQQAGILCNDERFQAFIDSKFRRVKKTAMENAAAIVRVYCKVDSRAKLDSEPDRGKMWDQLRTEYDGWRGAIGHPDERGAA